VTGNHLALLDNCLAIGNGESRATLDLKEHLQTVTSVGCNAIYRDFSVDHLICCDRRMVKEAKPFHTNIYTRSDWNKPFGVKQVPALPYQGSKRQDDPWHWGSGPYAVLLAASLAKNVHMIGFDLFSMNKNINNVYKGTENYNSIDYRAVDPSYWIYQISKVFECYQDKYFIVYNNKGWFLPVEWKMNNVFVETIDNFPKYL
jgi:hypothetical protein